MKGTGSRQGVLMLVENNSYPKDPRVRKEALALVSAGYRVMVVSPAERSQPFRETIDSVNVYRFPAPPLANSALGYLYEYAYSMAAIFLLTFWIFMRRGFDVIHAANPPDTLVFIAAFYKLLGKRFVFDHHDLAPEMYWARFPHGGKPWIYTLLLWCERCSCRAADHVFAVNESYKQIETGRDVVPETAITIVRNGPELSAKWTSEPDHSLRARVRTILAYAGIIGVQDGLDYLVRALGHLVVTLGKRDLLCLIIGEGDALPDLQQQAQALGIDRYIAFTGWVSDQGRYATYIATADICVDPSPSNRYNDCCTAIKIMEYMAAGKPVVAFDLPEHRVTAGSAALYAQPNDELRFAQAIAALMDDEPRRHAMGALGRRRVEQELAWHYSATRLLQAYRGLLPSHSRTRLRLA